MRCTRVLLGAALALAACADPTAPPASPPKPTSPRLSVQPLTARDVFRRYVALGTSNSQGAQSAGISSAT
jgi:hypothetical protein